MLVQSHLSSIDILPALPDACPTGRITGVCARGAFELDFYWKNGELRNITIRSKAGKTCKLKYGNNSVEFMTQAGKDYMLDGSLEIVN